MNDKKHIEEMEMAKIICKTINGKELKHCEVQCDVDCLGIAQALYEQNYRKIPKDSVVLSREEYESIINENNKLKHYNDKLSQGIYWGNGEQFCNRLKEVCKETAEKIYYFVGDYYDSEYLMLNLETFIREQYGVEIKE